MSFSAASQHIHVPGRQLTPTLFGELSLPSNFKSLISLRQFSSSSVAETTRCENDYLDVLSGVTDTDEIDAEQYEAAAAGKPTAPSLQRYDYFDRVPHEIDGALSMAKLRTRSMTTLEPAPEDEQRVCPRFSGAYEYVELLFDTETPLASDEDLALCSISAPDCVPEPATCLVACIYERSPTPKHLDTSNLRLQPILAVHGVHHAESETLNFDDTPVMQQAQHTVAERRLRCQGRSLTYSSMLATTKETATEQLWQLKHDPVIRYATAHSLLPGLEHLRNITAYSVIRQYDRDIEDLYYATACFLNDCHDGECSCLDGNMHTLCMPGENFVLADDNDNFGLSVRNTTAEDMFELIDELVDEDMFDMNDRHEDISEELQPYPEMIFDTTSRDKKNCVESGRLQYPPTLNDVSNVCDSENVSDSSETEDFSPTQCCELTYVDAETHNCIAYTAFNQLIIMEEDEKRPIIHRDIPDKDHELETDLNEHSYLYPNHEAHGASRPLRDNSYPSDIFFDSRSDISQPLALPKSNIKPTVRQRCLPYGLYSSNLTQNQRRLPRLSLTTQLLPGPEPLSIVEEEYLSCSSSSSEDSIVFGDHRGFTVPLLVRRQGFLDDEDEEVNSEDDSASPVTTHSYPQRMCEDMFTDAIWDTTPNLALTQPSREPYATITPAGCLPPHPLLEALEIEIHNRLTFIFNCLNNGRFDELPALSSDLHWTLCALVHDYPAMALLDSLGAAVEILVERTVASTFAS